MRAAGSSPISPRRRSTSSCGRVHGHEVGLGEVAVVLRLLLGPHRRRLLVRRVEVERLLLDGAAGLVDADLARDLALDPLRGEAERVHVLQLGARPQLVAPAGRTETLTSKRIDPFSSSASDSPSSTTVWRSSCRNRFAVVGVVDVGRGHDLDERRPAAVEVDERRRRAVDAAARGDVHVLRGVLLEVRAHDPDLDVAVRRRHGEAAVRGRAARRTGRSGTPSGGPGRSSSSGGRRRARRSCSRARGRA